MLNGDYPEADSTYNDDVLYIRDLGILASKDPLHIANPIYKEIIDRVLFAPFSGGMVVEYRPS